jgi:hypothetical protein
MSGKVFSQRGMIGVVPAKHSRRTQMYSVYQRKSRVRLQAFVCGVVLLAVSSVFVPRACATSIQFDFNHEFSSGTPPTGTAPWLRAIFSDVAPGSVSLTLIGVNLSATEFVGGWYFNLDPQMDATQLQFSGPVVSNGAVAAPGIQTGKDKFKADGDGKYDILFSFDTSGDVSQRFTAADSITFTLSGIADLTVEDFNFLSAPAGGHGPFISAAHVQGIGDGLSGWVDPVLVTPPDDIVTVPDNASTILLLGLALSAVEVVRRKLPALQAIKIKRRLN